jgi:branched-chain amino acid transport system permease protein
MSILLNVLIGGIAIGAVYAMMAIGFSLLWQTSRTINFAQGDFATVAAFIFTGLALSLGIPIAAAALLTVLCAVILLGYVVRKTIIARLLTHGVLPLVVATIALSILIQNLLIVLWTPQALRPPVLVATSALQLGDVVVNVRDVVNLLVATGMIVGLQVFLKRSKTGKALRATAQNAAVATVLGIDTGRMITVAFVINACLVAVAAMLLVPIYLVQYNMGIGLGLDAFYAAIIGGFNRVRGALVGGLVVGVLESLTAAYGSTQYKTAIVLAVLMTILLFKPEGLLGEKELVREYQG